MKVLILILLGVKCASAGVLEKEKEVLFQQIIQNATRSYTKEKRESLIESYYINDPKTYFGFEMNIEIGLENRLWKDSISKNQKEFILKMFTLPNTIPITPHLMASELGKLPATNYVWIYLLYDSSTSRYNQDRILGLAAGLSDYYYEYIMIGTIDLAYPSNKATFGNLIPNIKNIAETPSLIVRYHNTDHMAVDTDLVKNEHISLLPLDKWGYFVPRSFVENELHKIMRKILIENWTTLDEYNKIHAIYSVYYHDPEKRNMKIAIQNFDQRVHDLVYSKAIEWKPTGNKKDFNKFMLDKLYSAKMSENLRSELESIIRKNNAPPGLYLHARHLPDMRKFHSNWKLSNREEL